MNIRHLYFALLVSLIAVSFPPSLAHAQSVATVGFYNNDSGYISYYPAVNTGWFAQTGGTYARARQNDVHLTTTNNASIVFYFLGPSVTYWYSMATSRGSYDVYIDSAFIENVSAYKAGVVMRQAGRTWSVANPNIAHRIDIVFKATSGGTHLDVDGFSVGESYTLRTFNDTDGALRYSGNWSLLTGVSGAYNNDYTYSKTPGDSVRITFFGDRIRHTFTTGPDRGIAEIFIDGVSFGQMDMYNPTYVRSVFRNYSIIDASNSWRPQNMLLRTSFEGISLNRHTLVISISDSKNVSSPKPLDETPVLCQAHAKCKEFSRTVTTGSGLMPIYLLPVD